MSDTRRLTHDDRVTIRVDAEVKRRAAKAARRQGMSLSEAIRQFLRGLAEEATGEGVRSEADIPETVEIIRALFESAGRSPEENSRLRMRFEEFMKRHKRTG
jgi:antitoxin component of RelBE/YafQ-DinJ toxin-antitoxin module